MATQDGLKAQLAAQERWIHDHGANLAGYIERYGSKDSPTHFGEGGEAIFAADMQALEDLRAKLLLDIPPQVHSSKVIDPNATITAVLESITSMGKRQSVTLTLSKQDVSDAGVIKYDGGYYVYRALVDGQVHFTEVQLLEVD